VGFEFLYAAEHIAQQVLDQVAVRVQDATASPLGNTLKKGLLQESGFVLALYLPTIVIGENLEALIAMPVKNCWLVQLAPPDTISHAKLIQESDMGARQSFVSRGECSSKRTTSALCRTPRHTWALRSLQKRDAHPSDIHQLTFTPSLN